MKKIIYPTGGGGIAIITPMPECGLPIDEVARKDVPNGLPYLIVDAADVPDDRTFRSAWEADFNQPHGIGVGAEAWFAEQAAVEAAAQAEADRIAAEAAALATIEEAAE